MSERRPPREGFAPGSHAIEAHGGGAFAFAGMTHAGSILVTPGGVRAFRAARLGEVDDAALAPLFDELAEAPGSVEFVVVGAGAAMTALPKRLRARFADAGLRHETMATGPAVRVYNIMQSEGRRVAAVLIAVP